MNIRIKHWSTSAENQGNPGIPCAGLMICRWHQMIVMIDLQKYGKLVAIPQNSVANLSQKFGQLLPNPAWLTMLFRASTPARRRNCRASTNSATLFLNYPSIHPEIVHACMYFGTFLDLCIHHQRYISYIVDIIYTYIHIRLSRGVANMYITVFICSSLLHHCSPYDLALKQHQPVGSMYGISKYFM